MDVRWIAVAATLFMGGIGVWMKVSDGSLKSKKWWGTLGTLFILTGLVIGVGTILSSFHSRAEVADSKETPSVIIAGDSNTIKQGTSQTMTDSPGGVQVQGDNNIINQGPQDRRITKEWEFIQALRAVGPVAIRLEYLEDGNASFLFAQLYHLLIASTWTADERAQVITTPWMGVHVAVRDIRLPPPAAVKLVEQLQENDIASGLVPESNPNAFQGTAFVVRIGYQPRSNKK